MRNTVPNAVLLIGPSCPYCATMMETMGTLVKEGSLAHLEIVNVANCPDVASAYRVKSVPWLKIEIMQFQGIYPIDHLRHWIKAITSPQGKSDYLFSLLTDGKLDVVIDIVLHNPETLRNLTALLNAQLDLKIKLGISAVYEELQGDNRNILELCTDDLIKIIHGGDNRTRADATYLLSLIKNDKALNLLHELTEDSDKDVREIARDGLQNES